MRRTLLGVALLLVVPATASASNVKFSGSCQFSGPITPTPPITAVPRPGPHFSYRGSGHCSGTIGGPIAITFTNVSTLFDTCELGPDVELHGKAVISSARRRVSFEITIDLARAAVTGPFVLTTPGGGRALGTAQFTPSNSATAPEQCVSGGVGAATLAGSFQTESPLVGSASAATPAARRHRRPRCRHRHHRRGGRRRCSRRGR